MAMGAPTVPIPSLSSSSSTSSSMSSSITASPRTATGANGLRSPVFSPVRIAGVPNNTRPQCTRVKDITIPIGYRTTTNTVLKKIWKVYNTGSRPWPPGIRVCFWSGVVGPASSDLDEGVEVASIAPGESTLVEFDIACPKAGYKVGTYRLYETHHGDRRPFGPDLVVELKVRDPRSASSRGSSKAKKSAPNTAKSGVSHSSREDGETTVDEDHDDDDEDDEDYVEEEEEEDDDEYDDEDDDDYDTDGSMASSSQSSTSSAARNKKVIFKEEKNANGTTTLVATQVAVAAPATTSETKDVKTVAATSATAAATKRADAISSKDIVWGAKIGQGSFGEVYRGTLFGQEVALKKMRIQDKLKDSDIKDFHDEIEIMRKVRHPNVVQFLGACYEEDCLCIITEFLVNGSLEDLLTRLLDNGKVLSLTRLVEYAIQICQGVNWLHNIGIIHRDLKSGNILIGANNRMKLADFGLSHVKTRSMHELGSYGVVGTPCYMAPEVIKKEKYGVKADVFSLGVVLCEMYTGKYPFDIMSGAPQASDKFDEAVCNGLRPTLPEDCPPKLKSLMEDCWRHDPNMRPTVDQIITRLKEIPRQADEEAADIMEDLPVKAVALFDEHKRRIAELESELKATQRKLRTSDATAAEEKRARDKLQVKYDRLKQKNKASDAKHAEEMERYEADLEEFLQRTTSLEAALAKEMKRSRALSKKAGSDDDEEEESSDGHGHSSDDEEDDDASSNDDERDGDDDDDKEESSDEKTESPKKRVTKKKATAKKKPAAVIDDDDVDVISSELSRLQLAHAGTKAPKTKKKKLSSAAASASASATSTATEVSGEEPIGVRTRGRSPSPAVIDLRTPPKAKKNKVVVVSGALSGVATGASSTTTAVTDKSAALGRGRRTATPTTASDKENERPASASATTKGDRVVKDKDTTTTATAAKGLKARLRSN